MLRNTLKLNFCYLKIIHILYPRYHPIIIWHILKNKQKSKCVCIHEIVRLIIIKMKINMKKRSERHNVNRPRSRHRDKYSTYEKCFTMVMLTCIRQHLVNIWSLIHEKVKKELKKSVAYKKACNKSIDLICFNFFWDFKLSTSKI